METAVQTCYRHPDRRAGVRCQRCDRPICPACMHQASVGFQCPECARGGRQTVVRGISRTVGRPMVTLVLVAVNLAVFVAGIGSDLATRDSVVVDGGLIGLGFDGTGLVGVAEGQWWRIFTSAFLHANLVHVAFNCLLLFQLGTLLEPAFGRLRFGLVYLASLLGGGLGVLVVSPHSLTVGASGAVFGLMGGAFVALRARGIDPFSTGIGSLIVINLVLTFAVANISVGGHVGGLVGGVAATWLLTSFGPRVLHDARLSAVAVGVLCVATFAGCLLAA
ncbi:MAG: rhomboid family intramembrane serine protease [Acidimicrobiia bacterium]